jgi:signal transduction histidine kinase
MADKAERLILNGQSAAIIAAAHELKTPLTLINSITQTLNDKKVGLSTMDQAKYLDRLLLTSQRMLRLVQQLTLCYRLEDTDQLAFKFSLEPINAHEVCREVIQEMSPYASELGQELKLRGGGCPHLVIANREVFHGVVVNLIDNALRHNVAGAVVDVFPQCRRDFVRVHVHDDGAQITASQLGRLRQSLGREPQPLSGHSGTSGLGLYIVGQLTNAMGGSLGLGRAGKGTTFFVDLMRSRQTSLL